MLKPARIASCLDLVAVCAGRIFPWLLLPMTALVFVVVVLRYGFDFGFIALQESVVYLHAFMLMLGMGYTLHSNEHVRIDIFYNKMSEKNRALIDVIGNLLFLIPMCLVILFSGWHYAMRSWKILETSLEAGGLPLVFLLKTLIPAMAILLLSQAVANLIRGIIAIRVIRE